MVDIAQHVPHRGRRVPQSEPLDERQEKNAAGGYAYRLDPFKQLERFLVLVTEGGTYYASERDLTKQNYDALKAALAADWRRVLDLVQTVSVLGRAPKNDYAVFALAVAAGDARPEVRSAALGELAAVCRTGTHLFQFVQYVEGFRGWGRALRRAVAGWYTSRDPEAVAWQLVKYRQRGGWSHRDLLRLSHATGSPLHNALFQWAVKWKPGLFHDEAELPRPVKGLMRAFHEGAPSRPADRAAMITDYDLPRECVPTEWLRDREVWEALLPKMPPVALLRNLGNMAKCGLLTPENRAGVKDVVAKIGEASKGKRGPHPVQVLAALITYGSGQGARGSGQWPVTPDVADALDSLFYESFASVDRTGLRYFLGVDISGSMEWGSVSGVPGLSPRVAAAAMALVTLNAEPDVFIGAFCTQFRPLNIGRRERLERVARDMAALPMARTDCAQPVLYAMASKMLVDVFVVYTDNETWAGSVHPAAALREYRQRTGIDAKMAVVGMTSTGFSIADPADPGMLDFVGFDTATPQAVAAFADCAR